MANTYHQIYLQTILRHLTKEHNGTIKVESKEGEGSKFIIQLPAV